MAMANDAPLGVGDKFEGRQITKATIAVTNAGDGLSQAMKVDPVTLHQGDTVYVVLECEVGKITFDPYADEVCARVQNLKAGVATIIGKDAVEQAIEAQRDKIQAAKDAEAGQSTAFDFLQLAEEHEAGLHDTPAPGCPQCDNVPVEPEPDPVKKIADRKSRSKKATGDDA